MPSITLQFAPEMRQAIREGRKVCTTRAEPMGKVGDTFETDGRTYRIVDVSADWLGEVRDTLYLQEGFDCPEAFEAFWLQHIGEYSELQVCYVHWFARVDAERNAWLQAVKAPDFCPPQHDDGCPGSDCCECGERCARTAGRGDA